MPKPIRILGIETSCDETAAAVLEFDGRHLKLLSNAVASQVELHKLTGGVVPEVAAREHVTAIMPTIQLALRRAEYGVLNVAYGRTNPDSTFQILNSKFIQGIAVTSGPGLLPALMVGVDTANALSLATGIPVIPVQHITGHIYANFINESRIKKQESRAGKNRNSKFMLRDSTINQRPRTAVDMRLIQFPLLSLVVSGGHTEFILVRDYLNFKKVGATIDDAAGECFDKCAKILGLPYPGGPQISKYAENGNPQAFDFPRPLLRSKSYGGQTMLSGDNLNFSFAGLKTSVLYTVQKLELRIKKQESRAGKNRNSKFALRDSIRQDLAASIQAAIVETLVKKTEMALKKYKPKSFTLGGGVAANAELRNQLNNLLTDKFPKISYYPTKTQFATDNAAMIAAVGAIKLWQKAKLPRFVKVDPQLEIKPNR